MPFWSITFYWFSFCVKGDFILHSSIENVKEALDSMLNLFLFKTWLCIETMYSKCSFLQLLQLLLSSKIVYFSLILPKNKLICSFVLLYAAKCGEATEKNPLFVMYAHHKASKWNKNLWFCFAVVLSHCSVSPTCAPHLLTPPCSFGWLLSQCCSPLTSLMCNLQIRALMLDASHLRTEDLLRIVR